MQHLFYLMGGPNYEIVNNAEDNGIRCIDFRHEQAAAMAAHAYARVSRKPGVTTSASGPGTLNLLTGIYNAFIDCAPMVTLGGAGPLRDIYRGGFQEIDLPGIFAPVSKAVYRPTDASRMKEVVSSAFRAAVSDRPGPVYVECNEDVLYGEVASADVISPSRAAAIAPPQGDPELVSQALDILASANRPLILAGSGAWWSDASEELTEFVDRTGIPFYTTPISRGLVPEDHALSFPAARSTAFRQTDAVLVVGTRFNWIMSFGRRIAPTAKVVQIDIHAEEIGHNRDVDVGIVGDAKRVLSQLNHAAAKVGFKSKGNPNGYAISAMSSWRGGNRRRSLKTQSRCRYIR